MGEAVHRLVCLGTQIVDIQITTQRYEQVARIRGELVLENAGQRRRSLPLPALLLFGGKRALFGCEPRGVHQHSMLVLTQVVGPEIESILVAFGTAQICDEPTVW